VPHQIAQERDGGRRHERDVDPRRGKVVTRREHHAARVGWKGKRESERDERAERVAEEDRALDAQARKQGAQQRGLRARSWSMLPFPCSITSGVPLPRST
jgi:hypothetical protein